MKSRGLLVFCAAIVLAALQGCGGETGKKKKSEDPAKVETKRIGEAALTTIKLTPEAEKRLGIVTVEATVKSAKKFYSTAGEVVVPPGQSLVVEAAIAGSVTVSDGGLPAVGRRVKKGQKLFQIIPLLPVERDLRVNAEADVAAAATRVEVAKKRAERAARLLRDGVGSVRAQEDADEAVLLAETALNAARERLKQIEQEPVANDVTVAIYAPQSGVLKEVFVAENQIVSAGTPLCEIVQLDNVWIRTPVYSGDVASLAQNRNASVRPINADATSKGRTAVPVAAPPSADPTAGTTDLFYRLANPDMSLHPGERIGVSIPMKGEEECLQIPQAAILYDYHGGAWIYEKIEPYEFTRRRVSVKSVSEESVCLSKGLESGTEVVTDGAAELFGTEFGAGK